MSLVIPDEILTASHFSEEKRITIGKASNLLRMHLIKFQQFISSRNICIHYEIADLDADFRTLTG